MILVKRVLGVVLFGGRYLATSDSALVLSGINRERVNFVIEQGSIRTSGIAQEKPLTSPSLDTSIHRNSYRYP